jgi:hypothetical protein
MMQAHHGDIKTEDESDKVAEAILDGRYFRIAMKKFSGRNDPDDKEQWRNSHSSHALADNFCHKARKLERKLRDPSDAEDATSDQKDARWLALMAAAWRLVIGVYSYQGSAFAAAADLADKAGEADFFRNFMAPMFFAHEFAGFHVPELIPKEIA